MTTVEMTLYRCYWPAAFRYLNTLGERRFLARAYDLLMTLELNYDIAYAIAAQLPMGAVIAIEQVHTGAGEFEDPWAWSKNKGLPKFN